MQILEATLAFAITMFVLSMISSSFVEIIHRVFSMREAGLKHILGQIFDQVLTPYFARLGDKLATEVPSFAGKSLQEMRESFVERMSANRAPMGAIPNATPTGGQATEDRSESSNPVANLYAKLRLWNGRDLASMTPSEFMERLGSADFGKVIKDANKEFGAGAADAVDAVLKDVAQKFGAFGKEASSYFEGRARLLSVLVAIVLAFAIRADAVEILNTYFRDPNARNTVIEQTKAVTAQYEAATRAAQALKAVSDTNPPVEVKQQIEALKKDWQATVDSTRNTVKQYADIGLPIGWTKENATLDPNASACIKKGSAPRLVAAETDCRKDDGEKFGRVGYFEVVKLAFSIVLGGILIGLGGPFWYGAVTGLSNIRTIANEVAGGGTKGADKRPSGDEAKQPDPDPSQPTTPVGAFKVGRAAASG